MRKSKTTNEPGEPVDPALELQPTGGDLARGNTIILNPALHSAAANLTGTPSSASADGRSGATSVLFRKRTASKKPPALVLTKVPFIYYVSTLKGWGGVGLRCQKVSKKCPKSVQKVSQSVQSVQTVFKRCPKLSKDVKKSPKNMLT